MKREVRIRAVRVETSGADIPAHWQRALRRADDFSRLAVLAGVGAMGADAETSPKEGRPDIGVFLGTTTGPLETNFRFLDTLFDNGEGQASPTLFSHSVHNAAVGYLARLLNLQGPALTLTSPGWPFLAALAEAQAALENTELAAALVVAAEEESPLLIEAGERLTVATGEWQADGEEQQESTACRRGAVAWLLEAVEPGVADGMRLREIMLAEQPSNPDFYLLRSGERFRPDAAARPAEVPRSLAAALALSRALEECSRRGEPSLHWQASAPCGRAEVLIELP
ncbi:beta-ketoacyl synthase chain length factor [Desulfurivibrio dismutans]|uniref:beta-ketoacyl synthase chain length factor n=1 Tax=Desulfurivibrio dismutans TaxID=1398908 RepID=UPI0023DCA682|nr:beta-ketoacyl synthase chain length factor [Desulfurivibrio alkaliphilus]MDF1614730.1 beta-ketoacyl synthase chain length factor [Desulfurivibrio alkaliphilus]